MSNVFIAFIVVSYVPIISSIEPPLNPGKIIDPTERMPDKKIDIMFEFEIDGIKRIEKPIKMPIIKKIELFNLFLIFESKSAE